MNADELSYRVRVAEFKAWGERKESVGKYKLWECLLELYAYAIRERDLAYYKVLEELSADQTSESNIQ